MPPRLGQIVETILYTSNVPRLAGWYKDVMGLTPFTGQGDLPIEKAAGFHLPGDTILLLFNRDMTTQDVAVPQRGVIPKHGSPTGLGQHIAFGCDGLKAIDEWEAHFKEKGVPLVGRMDWERGGKSLYVHDWEGHVIEVMTRGVWRVY